MTIGFNFLFLWPDALGLVLSPDNLVGEDEFVLSLGGLFGVDESIGLKLSWSVKLSLVLSDNTLNEFSLQKW